MRIGIITQPLANNYGGLLQNYALQTVLKSLGQEPITLDQPIFKPRSKLGMFLLTIWEIVKNVIKLIVRHGNLQELTFKKEKRVNRIGENTRAFIDCYISKSPKMYGKKNLHDYCIANKIYDFIVGSDQVWNRGMNSSIYTSFLDFADNINGKKIAYAASFGVDFWNFSHHETRVVKRLIRNFSAVSCREKSGVELCQDFLHIDSKLVLDPTMLLNKEDYIELSSSKETSSIPNGILFTYILDKSEEKTEVIKEISKQKKLEPYSISVYGDNRENKDSTSVQDWLNAFEKASFVICDSFHAAVFSIIYNKEFLVLGNAQRGNARFDSLLELFDLKDRYVEPSNSFTLPVKPIDWKVVNRIREELKLKSIDFLKRSLA